jgi:flagella basal body P-ring formation protein FlgA
MLRFIICAIAVPLAFTVFAGAPAAAQSATPSAVPALRGNVTVTGDVVHIGDLVDNAGPVADIPVFRSPDLGTRGAVPVERVIEAIEPHKLIAINTNGLSEIIVTHVSRSIPPAEIAARIAKALEGQYGFGEARNIQIQFDNDVRTLHVESTATGELEVMSVNFNSRNAHFDISFDLPASTAIRRQNTRFTGTAIATVEAVAVSRAVERGEVIKASDLTVTRRSRSEGPLIADTEQVVGMAARHALRAGQVLRDTDLAKPAVVQRNDTVTIVYEAPGVTLTLRGQAQDAGAMGDTINVMNMQSKHLVQGVVTGPDRVTVRAAGARAAANEPQAPAGNEPGEPPSGATPPTQQQQQLSQLSSAE